MSSRSSSTYADPAQEKDSMPQAPHDEENAPASKEEQQYESEDSHLVDWDDDDKENPRNWSTRYKCWITFQLGMLALAASLGSSIISPAETAIATYVGVSREVTVLTISLYVYVPQFPACAAFC
jgi:hypothetical protein